MRSSKKKDQKAVEELKKVSDGYVKDLKAKKIIKENSKPSVNNTITEKANNG